LHFAVAPVASLFTECAAVEALAALAAAAGFAGAAAGAAGAAGVAAAVGAGFAAVAAAAGAASFLMPPWLEHAPRPPCGEVVPSVQVTGPLVSAAYTGIVQTVASTRLARARAIVFIVESPE